MPTKSSARLAKGLMDRTEDNRPRPLRVFIGLTEIAGVNAGLSKGFRDLGHEVTSAVLDPHPFGYESSNFDLLPKSLRLAIKARTQVQKVGRFTKLRRIFWGATDKCLRAIAFPYLLVKHDAFVLIFGTVLVGRWEGAIARLFGRSYVHLLLGSDARPPFLDAYSVSEQTLLSPSPLLKRSRRMRRQLGVLSRCCTAVVAVKEYGHYLTRPYVDSIWLGLPIIPIIPIKPINSETTRPTPHGKTFRILHSPSHEKMKGSKLIRLSIERLQKLHPEVEYTELKGVPNSVVRQALQETDLLVDQLYSDSPSPALATEAASLGVPTVLGTLHSSVRGKFGNPGYPSTITIDPVDLDQTLLRLLANRDELESVGRAAKHFVDENWTPKEVAKRVIAIIEGSNEVQMHAPGNCPLAGAGLSKRDLIASLSVVKQNGWEAFVFPDQDQPAVRVSKFLEELQHHANENRCTAKTSSSLTPERT
jgi:hypothetical protein